MRYLVLTALILGTISISSSATANQLVEAARERTRHAVTYDGAYVRLRYPGGDVPSNTGVCTDVVIRSYRAGYGYDLQKAVHEDMKANFSAYPKKWGLKRADKNIDHRRVPNLETFFKRKGISLPVTNDPANYKPGDVVSWMVTSTLPHIGIVSDRVARDGTPLIIHNVGRGPEEANVLFGYELAGHFRFTPEASNYSD